LDRKIVIEIKLVIEIDVPDALLLNIKLIASDRLKFDRGQLVR